MPSLLLACFALPTIIINSQKETISYAMMKNSKKRGPGVVVDENILRGGR